MYVIFFFKQKTAYEMRISDWSSDVCSSDLLATLGTPTFTSQFNQGDWYYVARDSRNLAYNNPRPVNQNTLQISFDNAGTVSSIRRIGLEQVASIHPLGKKTPTLGRERGFFDEL